MATVSLQEVLGQAPAVPIAQPYNDPNETKKSQVVSLGEVTRQAPSAMESVNQGIAGTIFGNDPTREGVERLGKLVRMAGGDFIEKDDGSLMAISNQDFIAKDENGELSVFAQAPVTGVLDKARRASGAIGMGIAGSTLPRAGKTLSAAKAAQAAKPTETIEEVTGAAPKAVEATPVASTPDRAGNINLDRVYAPEEIKELIRQTAKQNDEFTEARRGVITNEQTSEMARLLSMTPEKLAERVTGQAMNAEEMFAARELLVTQASKVKELAKAAKGGSDLDKANFAEEMSRLVAIQEQVAGATAEAGRALQQFRMMSGATKEQISRFIDAQKAGGLDDVIDKIDLLDDPAKVANFAGEAMKAKTSDKILEAWINALLSGPTTQATNILSNTLVAAWAIPETAVASVISKATGSGIRGREVLSRAFGFLEGAKDGIRAGAKTFITEEPSDLASKIEARRYKAIPGKTGKVVRIPGRLLMASDEFFKSIGYRQEINALAIRKALDEGLTGEQLAQRVTALKSNPTEEMRNAAHGVAEKQTFTNPLGESGQALIKWSNNHPWAKVIIPFIRTPTNIVKFAAERSPAAPLFKEVRANLKGENGAVARDTQIARIALGSSVGAVAAYMGAEGAITGQGPTDPKERALLYASGWQPYSIKIGDNYYSFSRMEPIGTLLGVAADFAELSKHATEAEKKNIATLIIGSISKNLTSKTFLKGLTEAIEAYQDPERYGGQWLQNFAGTVVPTGVAQFARARDPYLREARTILDKIKSRIPGMRETLPARRNVFGEPIKLEGALGPDILSPIYKSAAKNDPVISEMIRVGVAPSSPSRQIRNVDLEPEEYDVLQQATGSAARKSVETLISHPGWKNLPKETQADLIEDALRQARDIGRATVISQFPDISVRIAEQKRSELEARMPSAVPTQAQ